MPNPELKEIPKRAARKPRTRHSFDCQVLRLLLTAANCYPPCWTFLHHFLQAIQEFGETGAFRRGSVHTEGSTHECCCSACQGADCVNWRWVLNNFFFLAALFFSIRKGLLLVQIMEVAHLQLESWNISRHPLRPLRLLLHH